MSFLEIFQPGLKFLREERERQRLDVAYPTDGADPLMEIDLDAGTATIVVPIAPSKVSEPPAESGDPTTQKGSGPDHRTSSDPA